MADHPPPATPPKPVAGLVQSSAPDKRGFDVFSWGGVINPFNACSRYTGCPQAEPAKPALVSVAPLAAATEPPPETEKERKAREEAIRLMAENAVAFNAPGASVSTRADKFIDGMQIADRFSRLYGTEASKQIPEIFRPSPERDVRLREVSNQFIDTMYGKTTGPLPQDSAGSNAFYNSLALAQKCASAMFFAGVQDTNTSYARMGTTHDAFNARMNPILDEILSRARASNPIKGPGGP